MNAEAQSSAGHKRRPGVRGLTAGVLVLVVVGFAAFVTYWAASGGRWYIVRTPSMGTAAPVGTLVWVEPTSFVNIHPGQLITFTPPGSHTTYTHRVFARNADGTLSTKGDVNALADPWRLHAGAVIGVVSMRWWGIGWLVRAIPILVGGGIVLSVLLWRFTSPRWRTPAATIGTAAVLSLAVWILRPLVGAAQVSFAPTANGARATYVATGLLPTRMSEPGGTHRDLHDGQVGTLTTRLIEHDRYTVHLGPHLSWWCWAALLLACFLPALCTTAAGTQAQR